MLQGTTGNGELQRIVSGGMTSQAGLRKKNASSENNLPEFLAVQGKIEIFSIVFERRNLACQSDFLEGGGGGGGGGGGVGMGEWG